MTDSYEAPFLHALDSFRKVESCKCPRCNVVAQQIPIPIPQSINEPQNNEDFFREHRLDRKISVEMLATFFPMEVVCVKQCVHCQKFSLWVDGKLVWPDPVPIPASEYMPEPVKDVWDEAQSIATKSPAAAAGLLRHALERFCEHRGITTGTLASRINALGLPKRITDAAHACRHLGNDGVHEGFIYYPKDATYDIVVQMSKLLNLIVEQTVGVEEQTKALMDMHDNRK